MFFFIGFEVYLTSKMVELQKKHSDDKSNCSDHNDYYVGDGLYTSPGNSMAMGYNQMELGSKRKSFANESKASVYFTPNESVDQTQLQLSPIHINYIKENLDSFIGCLKPPSVDTKFCFDKNGSQYNVDIEPIFNFTDRKQMQSEDCNSLHDDLDTEHTVMMNPEDDSSNEDNCSSNPNSDYIHMNTFSKRKSKKGRNSNDLYYSLENVFDSKPSQRSYQPLQISKNTINETSEAQLTNSSASDNCITDDNDSVICIDYKAETGQPISNDKTKFMSIFVNPSQSSLFLNKTAFSFNKLQSSNSMPDLEQQIAYADIHATNDRKHVVQDFASNSDKKLQELDGDCNNEICVATAAV